MGAPATGKRAVFSDMDMYLVANGQITEVWHAENIASMLGQLGVSQHWTVPSGPGNGSLRPPQTVTGETPVVDGQNSTRNQRVLSDEIVAALLASRGYGNLLAVASGIQANGLQNSGIAPDMIDVQVSGILRSMENIAATNDPASNGASAAANLVVPNSVVQAALGRPLAGGATTVTVNLALPGDVYPERLNTVDMRVSKILRFGRTRSSVGIDLYNLFNSNTGTAFNQAFGTMNAAGAVNSTTWLRPTSILNARFVRFNATVDF